MLIGGLIPGTKNGGLAYERIFTPYAEKLICSLFADILVPDGGVGGDVCFEKLAAFAVVQVDDFDTDFAEPIEAAGEGAAFADNESANAKLAHQAAAVPTGRKRCNHDQVTITALSAGTTKGVGFGVHAGVTLLYTAVVSLADQVAGARKHGCANWNAPFSQAEAGLLNCHG
jgi:hypothetical protein